MSCRTWSRTPVRPLLAVLLAVGPWIRAEDLPVLVDPGTEGWVLGFDAEALGSAPLDDYFAAAAGSNHAFINNAGELFRLPPDLRMWQLAVMPSPIPVGERENRLTSVDYIGDTLYVFKAPDGGDTELFLASKDDGLTFEDLTPWFDFPDGDDVFFKADEVVTDRGRRYVSLGASGSLYYESANNAWTEIANDGLPMGVADSIAINDGVVLWGSGPGLLTVIQSDIWRAELNAEGTGWKSPPEQILETSGDELLFTDRIPAIAANPLTGTFLVSAGGILRSGDRGRIFSHVHRAPAEGEWPRPYLDQFLFPTLDARQVLAAGRENDGRAMLLWSADDGRTWTDISSILGEYRTDDSSAVFLVETPGGEIFVGVASRPDETLSLLKIDLPSAMGTFFPSAEFHGQGYWKAEGLGWIHGPRFPWVWISEQSVWSYVSGASEDNLWLWDSALGWLWTSRTIFPHFYRQSTDSYLYYSIGTHSPRWFYDRKAGDWIEVPS